MGFKVLVHVIITSGLINVSLKIKFFNVCVAIKESLDNEIEDGCCKVRRV